MRDAECSPERGYYYHPSRHSAGQPIVLPLARRPGAAEALFRDQQRRHEERLVEYERIRTWMEAEWGDAVLETDSPRFASYAALGRGILHERGSAEWCRWVADRLEGRPPCRAAWTAGQGTPGLRETVAGG